MLTAKPIKSANHALHYYKEDNYYLKEQGLGNAWWGKGAEALGLSGEVSTEQFNALINGKLPSGQQLGKKVEGGIAHRPGFDLTFSAPKSVSILALLGYDKRLLEAHHLAVKKTLSVIEQYAAQARVSHKGSGISYENTHNLVAALINHTVSREQDPQLHTHAVIFNMTQRQDGHWRALASRGNERGAGLEGFLERVYANTLHFGQYYRGELALQIRKLGYEIELSGKNACFEIKGVPIEVKTLFSSRRSQIESALAEKGLSGSKASSIATLDTRKAKESIDANTLESTWKDKAQGFDALLQTLYQDSEKNAHTKTPISASELRHLAKDAVLLATFSLTERESVFSETALFDKAWHQVFGLVSGEDLKGAIVQAKKDKVLLPTAYTLHGQPALTTPPAIALEKATLEEWRVSQGLFLPLVDIHKNPFEEKLSTLTKGQAQAATLILTNKDAVVGIQGYAGTGKTTLLKTVKAILDETQTLEKNNPSSFYRLHGLGPSTTAMQVLGKEVGISTQTVASFLKELERDPHQMTLGGALKTERQQHFNRHFEGLVETLDTVIQKKAAMTPEKEQEIAQQLGHLLMPPPLSKTVFILDEASFVSTRDMYALLKGINKLGARVVLLGDTLQLGAIEAGKPFAELQRAGMQKAVMQDILRQPKGSLLREAIYSTIDNDLGRAFQLLENHIVVTGTEKTPENINETTTPSKGEKTPQSRIGQIADHYLKLSEKEQAATLLLTASNVDRDALNTVVRKAFQHQGRIGPDNHPVYQLEPLNFTRIERMWAQNYPLHSIVRFNRAHRGLGIAKGSYWQVAENHPEQNRLVLRHGGRAIEWLPHLESGQYSGHVEVYEQKRRDLSVGEVLRWRRNDRDLPLANGQSCQVKSIDNDKSTLTLSVLETPGFNLASPQKREVILDLNATQSQHWSYGYVDTVHSAQGKTVDRVLALAQSYNVNLSTCRSFYVAISRARKEAWLYTDNIERYREQISSHLGEKTSALASGLREEWVPKPEVKEQARQERIGEEKEGLSSVVEKEKAPSAETRLKSEREQTTMTFQAEKGEIY
ncbi:MAG: exonuclease subunit alpha [Gammaproteobacteria bacterium]|nr:exonuclease subunit alpha [Gammaproteobacteria bacterium]